ncbi:MAG TPA: PEP-CTERM sorting domain-containing protein [Burkholderiaceae bacterium]
MNLKSLATGLCAVACCASASASAYLYTFQFGPLTLNGGLLQFEPASISYTSDHIAVAGDSLTWLSGDINGCAPSSLKVDSSSLRNSFYALPDEANHCSNDVNPRFTGLLFYAQDFVTGPGFYDAPDDAARMFDDLNGGWTAFYADGSLTVSEIEGGGGTVPEPATLALASLALVAAVRSTRRRR